MSDWSEHEGKLNDKGEEVREREREGEIACFSNYAKARCEV